MKRKEVKLKNNPGLSKLFIWNDEKQKWIDTGKYRSMRRVSQNGKSVKESAVFHNVEDAKAFRSGELNKHEDSSRAVHKVAFKDDSRLKFGELVEQWRSFHYLTVEASSQSTYEDQLRPVERFLYAHVVEEISATTIDDLIRSLKTQHEVDLEMNEATASRKSFKRQLDVLKLVLNFYRMRVNARYLVPIFRDHYRASIVVKKAFHAAKAIREEDLPKFFLALKRQKKAPHNYLLALTQFCLMLRACELCGLYWEDFDWDRNIVTIQRSVVWDRYTWQPSIKERPKNGRAREIAIPSILKEELLAFREATKAKAKGLVFHREGRPLIRKAIAVAYQRALDIARIDYVRGTHAIRRSSATHANAGTGNIFAVSENLGHSNVEETHRYVEGVSHTRDQVAKVLDSVARFAVGDRALLQASAGRCEDESEKEEA